MPPTRTAIRPEMPAEFDEIRSFVETAFATAAVSTGDEQSFVDRLRGSDAYRPDLALVAIEGDEIVGHVMLTRTTVAADDGDREVLLLAPLAVGLAHRRRGVATRLMSEALARATAAGFGIVVLVGDPAFYTRFGFRRSTDLGLVDTDGIPAGFVQALEIAPGAAAGLAGRITFAT